MKGAEETPKSWIHSLNIIYHVLIAAKWFKFDGQIISIAIFEFCFWRLSFTKSLGGNTSVQTTVAVINRSSHLHIYSWLSWTEPCFAWVFRYMSIKWLSARSLSTFCDILHPYFLSEDFMSHSIGSGTISSIEMPKEYVTYSTKWTEINCGCGTFVTISGKFSSDI